METLLAKQLSCLWDTVIPTAVTAMNRGLIRQHTFFQALTQLCCRSKSIVCMQDSIFSKLVTVYKRQGRTFWDEITALPQT